MVVTRNPGSCCRHFQTEHIRRLSLEVAGRMSRKLQFKGEASQVAHLLAFKGTDLRHKPENV